MCHFGQGKNEQPMILEKGSLHATHGNPIGWADTTEIAGDPMNFPAQNPKMPQNDNF
jgi:hypothetical protein